MKTSISIRKKTQSSSVESIGIESSPTASQGSENAMLMSSQPKLARDIWSKVEYGKLLHHLHNGNPPTAFVMGFQRDGIKSYSRSKNLKVHAGIQWATSTVFGKSKPGKYFAFVPYSKNANGVSRWGCLDFDAHDGNGDRAWNYAFQAFLALANYPYFIILENSGGGWHVWAIDKEFRPVSHWSKLLRNVARGIQAPVESGVCEFFPDDGDSNFGKGVRAPGSWNPRSDTLNQILWENTGPLIEDLSLSGNTYTVYSGAFPDREKDNISSPSLYHWNQWKEQVGIVQVGTRHSKAMELAGLVFNQVGRNMAECLAEAQFNEKKVRAQASKAEHLADFKSCWEGLEQKLLADLSPDELEIFKTLTVESHRDAFRIIRSFARKAKQDGRPDFPVARDDLAARLGFEGRGGTKPREAMVTHGLLQRVKEYEPNRSAARYIWLPFIQGEANPF